MGWSGSEGCVEVNRIGDVYVASVAAIYAGTSGRSPYSTSIPYLYFFASERT